MTLSIWRYSHLMLALVSGAFLLVAASTGIVLAFEPIVKTAQGYDVADLEKQTLAETLHIVQKQYDEVLELRIDADNYVLASVITKQGENARFYIDPTTGATLGQPYEKAAIFKFTTTLHRSLFLKGTGRLFVGIASFLLLLIAITGSILILKRQGSIGRFIARVKRESFEQYYHILFGRLFLIPIALVALTGVYLSMEKFDLFPSSQINTDPVFVEEAPQELLALIDFPIFKSTTLSEVKSIVFPFSKDPEEYFELALKDREVQLSQVNGKVISEAPYPFVTIASSLSLAVHTGEGSIVWSLVLLLTSCSVLFFIYSGFKMAWQRKRKRVVTNMVEDKDRCEFIILVGSETGGTYEFAKHFQKALLKNGKTVFLTALNSYSPFRKAKHLIVFTATYGNGEAPSNARQFEELFKNTPLSNRTPISFSVVGFGSILYPDYCQFAIDVDTLLATNACFTRSMELHKINDQSYEAFKSWVQEWSNKNAIPVQIKPRSDRKYNHSPKSFELVARTPSNVDDTFLVRLRPKDKINFRSGDLLAIKPEKQAATRLYSIAKMNTDILLSVKRHRHGLCSNHLDSLGEKDTLEAGVKRNPNFHFPKKARSVVLICNGTGIAPFLGMLYENTRQIPVTLFWGGRTKNSYAVYQEYIANALKTGNLHSIKLAYSREREEKTYVQDLVFKEADFIAGQFNKGATFMICGSVGMQKELLEVLNEITRNRLHLPLSDFEQNEQLKMDCY